MTTTFDPERILEVLHRHGVEFVLIGGVAAVTHGFPSADDQRGRDPFEER
jgi:hypothetical protein